MEGFKAKGSFGVPDELKRHHEAARKKLADDAANEAAKTAAPVEKAETDPYEKGGSAEKVAAVDLEASQAEQYKKAKKELEDSLEVTISEDDIKSYIFKGRLVKEVSIFPGVLKATFQTLNAEEHMVIDEQLAKYIADNKYTSGGIDNQHSITLLSHAWIMIGGKPFTSKDDPPKRESHIRKMGTTIIDATSKKYNELNTLIKLVLNEKSFLKK